MPDLHSLPRLTVNQAYLLQDSAQETNVKVPVKRLVFLADHPLLVARELLKIARVLQILPKAVQQELVFRFGD
jgi:hypothetical protein